MKKLLTLTFALFFTAGIAFAQSDASIDQTTSNSDARIVQIGPNSGTNALSGTAAGAYITQSVGNSNEAFIKQNGARNLGTIDQEGSRNLARVVDTDDPEFKAGVSQRGNHNWGDVDQTGNRNQAEAKVVGNQNYLLIDQDGNRNGALSAADGNGNTMKTVQDGNQNAAYAEVDGNVNTVDILQDGSFNRVTGAIGAGGLSSVTGSDNIVDVDQLSDGNQAAFQVTGSHNSATILQQ